MVVLRFLAAPCVIASCTGLCLLLHCCFLVIYMACWLVLIVVLDGWRYRSGLCGVDGAEMAGAGIGGLGLESS